MRVLVRLMGAGVLGGMSTSMSSCSAQSGGSGVWHWAQGDTTFQKVRSLLSPCKEEEMEK